MDAASTDHPHSGATCLKVDFTATQTWGGVVWQSPANAWGDKPGGFNKTGFCWVAATTGHPATFYIDDLRNE